jgi:hypothetical protein
MKFSPGRLVWTRYINDCVADNAQFAKFVTDSLANDIAMVIGVS